MRVTGCVGMSAGVGVLTDAGLPPLENRWLVVSVVQCRHGWQSASVSFSDEQCGAGGPEVSCRILFLTKGA
jgi:hypothetical protein